jgi:hypothetical protein
LLRQLSLELESRHLSKIPNGRISKRSGQNTVARKKYNKRLFLFRYGNYSNYTVQYTSAGPFPGNYLGRELVGATTHNQSIMPQIPSENNLFITQ